MLVVGLRCRVFCILGSRSLGSRDCVFAREFSHGSGACTLEMMMRGKGDPGSPTRDENGQAGIFVGAGQPIPPSSPSSDGQIAKGGSVSGLGKGYGGNTGFQQSYMPGPIPVRKKSPKVKTGG